MKRISAALSLFLWTAGTAPAQEQQMLHAGWLIQSSAKVSNDGAAISAVAYQPTGWYRALSPARGTWCGTTRARRKGSADPSPCA